MTTAAPPRRPRLVYIVTHAMSANLLLRGQLRFMQEQGFDVTVIASPGPHLDAVREREQVEVVPLAIERDIHPGRDLRSLIRLVRTLARIKPDVVNAGTPKAGLLGMLAAALLRVPVRVYIVRGLRVEGTAGLKQRLLETTERIASAAAQVVVPVSESLRAEYVRRRLACPTKTRVIGGGSSNGIDVTRFDRSRWTEAQLAERRQALGIPEGAPVVGFVGRFTRDKGIGELLNAYELVRRELPDARLLLLGDFEEGDPVPAADRERIERDRGVVRAGFVRDTSEYYPLMDVFAFPSRREGFPNAPLEAAAAGVPTVGFAATGTVDAVQDGATGFIVPMGDSQALGRRILEYLRDPELRAAHGAAAQARATRDFTPAAIWGGLRDLYVERLGGRALVLRGASTEAPVA